MKTCPVCRGFLDIKELNDEENSKCENCGYSQPAGSAHFVTFITEVMSQFLKNLGVEKLEIGGSEFTDFDVVLADSSFLPAVLVNAKQNALAIGTKMSDIGLTTVNDADAYYQKRVVTTSKNINPAIALTVLAQTLKVAFDKSMAIEKYASNKTMCIDFLEPINAYQVEQIKEIATYHESIANNALNPIVKPTMKA